MYMYIMHVHVLLLYMYMYLHVIYHTGGAALDLKTSPHKPAKWITDINWLNVVALSKLSQFTQILEQARNNTIIIHVHVFNTLLCL